MNRIETVITPHPSDYEGIDQLSIVTIVDHKCTGKKSYVTKNMVFDVIIDNVDNEVYGWYNINMSNGEAILVDFYDVVIDWVNSGKRVPLSIYLSNNYLDTKFNHMYQRFNINEVAAIQGDVNFYDMVGGSGPTIKKRTINRSKRGPKPKNPE